MSAFVVEDQTINEIVNFLEFHESSWPGRIVFKETNILLNSEEGPKQLAEEMFKLNVEAVNQRYGENEAHNFRPLDFKFGYVAAKVAPVQAFKSLKCWLYQCSEGNVPETPLYKTMDQLSGWIAETIVRELPEYEQARW